MSQDQQTVTTTTVTTNCCESSNQNSADFTLRFNHGLARNCGYGLQWLQSADYVYNHFIGWSNNDFNNLHFRIHSKQTNNYVSNTQ